MMLLSTDKAPPALFLHFQKALEGQIEEKGWKEDGRRGRRKEEEMG